MFKYDPELVPDVELENQWQLTDGNINQLYRVGDWSMELPEDGNLKQVKDAIYAWIAWHDFLVAENQIRDNES